MVAKDYQYVIHVDCFPCRVTHDMMRDFCPHCGNQTLQRISMTTNDDGSVQYFMSRRKMLTSRGKRVSQIFKKSARCIYKLPALLGWLHDSPYAVYFLLQTTLPKPQGGKYAQNPILVEDQREPQQRQSKMAQQHTNVFGADYECRDSPFATRDVYSRSAQLGYKGNKSSATRWNKRNRNEAKGKYGRRK